MQNKNPKSQKMLLPPHLTKQAFKKFFPTKSTGGYLGPPVEPRGSLRRLRAPPNPSLQNLKVK